MYPDWVWLLPAAVFIWLGVLSFLIWQQGKFLTSLFPKSGERDIRKKFEEMVGALGKFNLSLAEIRKKLVGLEQASLQHIQKVELMRYNPYDDTGGDQSFSVAILDNKGTGFVITSLHARSGTRVFAKPVLEGKADKYQFSEEEEQIVKKALGR